VLNVVLVFVGGGIGAAARYWLQGIAYQKLGSDFPYGTLIVNVVGCVLIGFLMSSMEERFLVHPSLRVLVTIGILGGFTTFSSFSFETIAMLRDGEVFRAAVNVIVSVGVCLAGAWIGLRLGELL
jgi:CrcB protein